jgi:ribosomal protein S18 acetylase RimI-like enzyme
LSRGISETPVPELFRPRHRRHDVISGKSDDHSEGRLADVNAIVTLEETLFPRDYPISQRNLARFVHSPTAKMIVVEDAGQIAGCAIVLFRCRSAIARVYTIGVVSSHRGRGIGSKLLQAAERAAVARHCAFIRLEVRPGNKRAIRLYRTHGYRKFGRHANYLSLSETHARIYWWCSPPKIGTANV